MVSARRPGARGGSSMTPAEAFDCLPKSLRIGGCDWQIVEMVVQDSLGRNRWAECRPAALEIAISRNLPSVQKLIDTFWHEVLHAFWATYHIQDDDKEERVVLILGTAILSVFRDNPELLLWLDETQPGLALHYLPVNVPMPEYDSYVTVVTVDKAGNVSIKVEQPKSSDVVDIICVFLTREAELCIGDIGRRERDIRRFE
jgi:hypothetical protein